LEEYLTLYPVRGKRKILISQNIFIFSSGKTVKVEKRKKFIISISGQFHHHLRAAFAPLDLR